jgi:hypothetical protein
MRTIGRRGHTILNQELARSWRDRAKVPARKVQEFADSYFTVSVRLQNDRRPKPSRTAGAILPPKVGAILSHNDPDLQSACGQRFQ